MAEPRQRISRGRSRNGCATCRARRVKCDEQKPACYKCLSTGRKCGGYADHRGSPGDDTAGANLRMVHHVPGISQAMRMWQVSQSSELLHEVEYRSLEFFQLHTTHCFGGEIGLFFLQAAHNDPIIRTIAVAIGSLHRSFVYQHKGLSATQEETHFTLVHYNKAIRQLVAVKPHSAPKANDTFLIACVLFFCYECLQGYYKSAFQHALSGLKIIKQQQLSITQPSSPTYMPQDTIGLIFTILENQVIERESGKLAADQIRPAVSSPLARPTVNLSPAWSTVEDMLNAFQLVYNRFTRFGAAGAGLEELEECHTFEYLAKMQYIRTELCQILDELKSWTMVFDTWINSSCAQNGDSSSVMLLRVWRVVVGIIICLEWPPSECDWDPYMPEFTVVVSLVADMLKAPSSIFRPSSSPPVQEHKPSPSGKTLSYLPTLRPRPSNSPCSAFLVTLGVVAPLYMCATRCRDSVTRHQAVALLLYCQRREGLWDSDLAGRIAGRLVTLEEAAANIEPGATYTPADIPLSARAQTLDLSYEADRRVRIRYNVYEARAGLDEEILIA